MSEASSTTFQRVISEKHFLGKRLLLCTLCAIVSAALLVVVILCSGCLAELLLHSSSLKTSGGLLVPLSNKVSFLKSPSAALTCFTAMIVVSLCLRSALRSFSQKQIAQHVSDGVNRLREHIQRHAIRSNPGDLSGEQRSVATTLFESTAGSFQDRARQWGTRLLTSSLDLLAVVVTMIAIQWRVGMECLIPVVVCWWILRIESERHEASSNLLVDQVDRGLQRLMSDLDKARIVASYGMENLEHEQFRSHLDAFQKRSDTLWQQKNYSRWTELLILITCIALPAFLLARHLLFGCLITLPEAVMIGCGIGLVLMILRQLQDVPILHSKATVAADEIHQYLHRVPPVSQVVGARFLEPMQRSLQFNQVSFETETNPDVLRNLDLKIESGQTVALLAINELEAKALVSMIPRFCDPTTGQVLIDGKDIRRATLESLRAEAIVVGGSEPVFTASVLENVTAGNADISRQDAIEACKIAHAESFIRQLPKGYETQLGTEAVQLTPGQTFRLSLARAIARKPALLVVQEPSESLDEETKNMLDDTNSRIANGRTVIFLPTRLSTVKKCDRVVVLHGGRIAADGSHEELVKSSDVYRHWEYVRFNVFRD